MDKKLEGEAIEKARELMRKFMTVIRFAVQLLLSQRQVDRRRSRKTYRRERHWLEAAAFKRTDS